MPPNATQSMSSRREKRPSFLAMMAEKAGTMAEKAGTKMAETAEDRAIESALSI